MASILRGSYRPSIHGGTFNAINATYHGTRPSGFDKIMEEVCPNAFYDSDNRPDPPKCHPNTRVAVISKIIDWATGMIDTDAFMLWLYGPAGAGKTAIARKVAELFAEHGLLLASFLFFRSDPKRNTMKPLVTNIAYRVACVIPATHNVINTAMEADPLILSYSVEVQFTKLVLEPLRLLADQGYFVNRQSPLLVVIDGLDECLDKGAQTDFIQFLSSSVAQYPLPLKFLIVSRPEAHIKSAVSLIGERSNVSHIELNDDFLPDVDIRRFLTDKFRDIKKCHPFCSGIPPGWPSEQQIDTLIRKASGQFIYASLAIRFTNSPFESPMRQLDIVLELRPPINHDLPFAELDTLYTFILSCTKDPALILRILGVYDVVFDFEHNAVEIVEFVLGLEDGDVRIYLSPLSSLLEVEEGEVFFHHSSFMDFLRSPERSKSYHVNPGLNRSLVAQRILELFPSIGARPCEGVIEEWWVRDISMQSKFLVDLLWTPELECALERFSISKYLDCCDNCDEDDEHWLWDSDLSFTDVFLNYLEHRGKFDLYHHHSLRYLEHATSSISNPPSREKFAILRTVWFVLQEPFTSLQSGIKVARWDGLCAALFGFNSAEVKWDWKRFKLMRDPTKYDDSSFRQWDRTQNIPKPILSYRLARVAISCMQYLHRQDPNTPPTQDQLVRWAMKSGRSPWLWRKRMRVISMAGRQLIWNNDGHKCSFSQSFRRSSQILYSKGIHSELFHLEQRTLYIWTLDLLYYTLRKAMKFDELTRALSKPFIPPSMVLLFPRRIQRVKKAVEAYLAKFNPSSLDASNVEVVVRRSMRRLPQSFLVAFNDNNPEISRKVFLAGRDATERLLKQNIDKMLDAIYSPTGAHPETIEYVSSAFHHVNKVGAQIERRQMGITEGSSTGGESTEDSEEAS